MSVLSCALLCVPVEVALSPQSCPEPRAQTNLLVPLAFPFLPQQFCAPAGELVHWQIIPGEEPVHWQTTPTEKPVHCQICWVPSKKLQSQGS